MKRLAMVAAVMLVALSVAFGATNEVTSVNAVGFIRTTVPANGWELISLPFERLDGEATYQIVDLFPDAPLGTRVWFYSDGAWNSETKSFGGWVTDPIGQTNEFIRGDALFVNNTGGSELTLTVLGEVPDARSAPDSTTVLGMGWTLTGFSYPVDIALTNTTLSAEAVLGDRLWWWNQDHADGVPNWDSTTMAFGGWTMPDLVLKAGQGFFFNNNQTANIDWDETKPYVWP